MANARSNGYEPSIMQEDLSRCYICGRTDRKLDRHEVFGGAAYRSKSKRLGLWVMLCHEVCHQGDYGVHANYAAALDLRMKAEERALEVYGWDKERFIQEFGKNYL